MGNKQTERLMGHTNKNRKVIKKCYWGNSITVKKDLNYYIRDTSHKDDQTIWVTEACRQTGELSVWRKPSVRKTSEGRRRFKASMVDTSAASPHTVSAWRQELKLSSQCKLPYHHHHRHYHEKWKSDWAWCKAFKERYAHLNISDSLLMSFK